MFVRLLRRFLVFRVFLAGFQIGEALFQGRHLGGQGFLALAGGDGDRRHGVELLARHQVHLGQQALQLLAEARLDLGAHTGGHAHRAARHLGHVFQDLALALHRGSFRHDSGGSLLGSILESILESPG